VFIGGARLLLGGLFFRILLIVACRGLGLGRLRIISLPGDACLERL
jgi:hypothetical protein